VKKLLFNKDELAIGAIDPALQLVLPSFVRIGAQRMSGTGRTFRHDPDGTGGHGSSEPASFETGLANLFINACVAMERCMPATLKPAFDRVLAGRPGKEIWMGYRLHGHGLLSFVNSLMNWKWSYPLECWSVAAHYLFTACGLDEKKFPSLCGSEPVTRSSVICTVGQAAAWSVCAFAAIRASCRGEVAQLTTRAGSSAQAASHSINRQLVWSIAFVL
jgi:hypothetical protein